MSGLIDDVSPRRVLASARRWVYNGTMTRARSGRIRRLAVILALIALGYVASSIAFRRELEPLSPFIFTLF